jgi:hypothetical protein
MRKRLTISSRGGGSLAKRGRKSDSNNKEERSSDQRDERSSDQRDERSSDRREEKQTTLFAKANQIEVEQPIASYGDFPLDNLLGLDMEETIVEPGVTFLSRELSFECSICLENCTKKAFDCGHSICIPCAKKFIAVKVDENHIADIKCTTCHRPITLEEVRNITDKKSVLFLKYVQAERGSNYEKSPLMRFCPDSKCQYYFFLDKHETEYYCERCNCHICHKCGNLNHGLRLSCVERMREIIGAAKDNAIYKPCPNCMTLCENIYCNKQTCTRCGYIFCWDCLGKYDNKHKDCIKLCDERVLQYYRKDWIPKTLIKSKP